MSQKISENMTDALNAAFGGSNVTSLTGDRKQSQVYLNVGMYIKGADGETVFASLPFGIPIDTQEPKAMTTSPKLNHSIDAGNKLLAALQQKAGDIPSGEALKLNATWQMELRKRKSTDVKLDDTPEVVIDMAELFA